MNTLDPVTLDICWNRLVGVVNEQAGALVRTIDGRPPVNPKTEQILKPNDVAEVRLPGGGGYGPPAEREPIFRERDRVDGYAVPR